MYVLFNCTPTTETDTYCHTLSLHYALPSVTDADVERRLRLWLADCAARVLHIYEKTEASAAPREAIIAARRFARGEIDAAALATAWAARSEEHTSELQSLMRNSYAVFCLKKKKKTNYSTTT